MGVIGGLVLTLWLSALAALSIGALALRGGPRLLAVLRTLSLASLLPGIVLVLWPGVLLPDTSLAHASLVHTSPAGAPAARAGLLACRVLGAVPLLLLPLLAVLARIPPWQTRTASGLGADRLARLRLLWLPQLGPPMLAGLALAGMVDAASLSPWLRSHPICRDRAPAPLSPPVARS